MAESSRLVQTHFYIGDPPVPVFIGDPPDQLDLLQQQQEVVAPPLFQGAAIEHTVHSSPPEGQSNERAIEPNVMGSALEQMANNITMRNRGNNGQSSDDLLGLTPIPPPTRVMSPTPCMYLENLKVRCTQCREVAEPPAMCNHCGNA